MVILKYEVRIQAIEHTETRYINDSIITYVALWENPNFGITQR